jgi:hypothetical protein
VTAGYHGIKHVSAAKNMKSCRHSHGNDLLERGVTSVSDITQM